MDFSAPKLVARALGLLVALFFAVAALPLCAMAYTSAQLSDDGQDYGIYYRRGDYFFLVSEYQYGSNPEQLRHAVKFALAPDGRIYDGTTYFYKMNQDPSLRPWNNGGAGVVGEENYYRKGGIIVYKHGPHADYDAIIKYQNKNYDQIIVGDNFSKPDGGGGACVIFNGTDDGTLIADGSSSAQNSNRRIISFREYHAASELRRVIFDDTVYRYWGSGQFEPGAYVSSSDRLIYLDGWFEGYPNLASIEGISQLYTGQVVTMARMFKNSPMIEELDLSGFDTAACADFTDMFTGCVSLITLKFGSAWTQDAAADEAKATFPVNMRCTMGAHDGEVFSAGAVIPNGSGTYVVADRVTIRQADVGLKAADGSLVENARMDSLSCEYTGSAIEPTVILTVDGMQLEEGVDFRVEYENNVEAGAATARIYGIGAYYGCITVPFEIVDSGAYAFLFSNGTLCLKAGHGRPGVGVVSASAPILLQACLFDALTKDPGANVAWAKMAPKVKRVVIDSSFGAFTLKTMKGWFAGCTALESITGLKYLKTASGASMADLFKGCTSLTKLDLMELDASKATDFSGFVQGCTSLTTLDMSKLDTSKGVNFSGFAQGCTSLEKLNLGGLDTSMGTNFSNFARGCTSLTTLYLNDIDLSRATTTSGFVTGCPKLTTIKTNLWKNAANSSAKLKLGTAAFRTSPSYKRYAAADPIPNGTGEYRFRDLAMQFTKVEMPQSDYTATGKAITPALTVKLGDIVLQRGVDYTVTYKDNLYPGTATATVTGKGVLSGGLNIPFTISARLTAVGDRLTYTKGIATFTLEVTGVSKQGTTATATVTKIVVSDPKAKKLSIPSTCTIGNVKVTVTAVSSKISGKFRNVKTIVIGPKVVKIGARAFVNAKKARQLIVKSARLTSVKNCLAGSFINRVKTQVWLPNADRTKYRKWFTKKAGKSGVTFIYG